MNRALQRLTFTKIPEKSPLPLSIKLSRPPWFELRCIRPLKQRLDTAIPKTATIRYLEPPPLFHPKKNIGPTAAVTNRAAMFRFQSCMLWPETTLCATLPPDLFWVIPSKIQMPSLSKPEPVGTLVGGTNQTKNPNRTLGGDLTHGPMERRLISYRR